MLRLKSIKREGTGWNAEIVDDETHKLRRYSGTTLSALLFRMKQATKGTVNNIQL